MKVQIVTGKLRQYYFTYPMVEILQSNNSMRYLWPDYSSTPIYATLSIQEQVIESWLQTTAHSRSKSLWASSEPKSNTTLSCTRRWWQHSKPAICLLIYRYIVWQPAQQVQFALYPSESPLWGRKKLEVAESPYCARLALLHNTHRERFTYNHIRTRGRKDVPVDLCSEQWMRQVGPRSVASTMWESWLFQLRM